MKSQQSGIHADFFAVQKAVYEPHGWVCKNIEKEAESAEYGACTFEMNDHRILFRVAKITPTKIGQFVTLWKRIGKGPIMPYDKADLVDLFVISVRNKDRFGQFVFPMAVLLEKGIVSEDGKVGKLAIRVYPAWDVTDNPQAKRTQAWQLNYFFEISSDALGNREIIEKLYKLAA